MPIFRVKSVKNYTGQKNLHWRRQPRQRQLSGMMTGKLDFPPPLMENALKFFPFCFGLLSLFPWSRKDTAHDVQGHNGDVAAMSLHPSEEAVFVTGSVDKTARLWDLRFSCSIIMHLTGKYPQQHWQETTQGFPAAPKCCGVTLLMSVRWLSIHRDSPLPPAVRTKQ